MIEIRLTKDSTWGKGGDKLEVKEEEARMIIECGGAVYERLQQLQESQEKKEVFTEEKQQEMKQVINSYFDKSDLAEQLYEVQPYYFDKGRNWWLWNAELFCWEIVDKTDILISVKKLSTFNTVNAKEKNEIIEAMEQYGREKKPKEIKPTWIQFRNLIVDIKTGEEFKASPEFFVVNPIPHKLGKIEETPTIDKLFYDWVGKEEDSSWTKTLEELASYCLLPDYPISTCCALLGIGRNGKSTYQGFIERLVGKNNITTANLRKLVKERFEAWRLYKKLVCLMGEIDFGILKDTDTFKRLTGGDNMDFESKGKDGITARTYAKLLIACNQLPESFDKSEGYFRRWLIIDFPHKFEEKPHLLDIIPEEEYENFCRKAVGVLKGLLEKGCFTNQGTIAEREKRYEDRSNPFGMFLKEYCDMGVNYEAPFWKLYDVYVDFLKQRNFRIQSKIEFNRALKIRGIKISTPRPTGKVNAQGKEMSWTYSLGLKLKEEYETMEEI